MGPAGEHAGSELTARALPETPDGTALRKHSVRIAGHATSISLENAFWEALVALAAEEKIPLAQLIERIDAGRRSNLSGAIRVYVLERYRSGTGGPAETNEG